MWSVDSGWHRLSQNMVQTITKCACVRACVRCRCLHEQLGQWIVDDISYQKMYGVYGLTHHIVEISGDVTDAGRMDKREDGISFWSVKHWVSQYCFCLQQPLCLFFLMIMLQLQPFVINESGCAFLSWSILLPRQFVCHSFYNLLLPLTIYFPRSIWTCIWCQNCWWLMLKWVWFNDWWTWILRMYSMMSQWWEGTCPLRRAPLRTAYTRSSVAGPACRRPLRRTCQVNRREMEDEVEKKREGKAEAKQWLKWPMVI